MAKIGITPQYFDWTIDEWSQALRETRVALEAAERRADEFEMKESAAIEEMAAVLLEKAEARVALAASQARVARLEEGLKAMEFRKEMSVAGTVNEFCPVCHGGPCQIPLNPHQAATNGHRKDCPLYALIASTEATP